MMLARAKREWRAALPGFRRGERAGQDRVGEPEPVYGAEIHAGADQVQCHTPAMDLVTRRSLAHQALAGYVRGPSATTRANAEALERVEALARERRARAVVLVEGISDQIAVETLALRRGRDLATEGVVVLPMGGAHAITRHLRRLGPGGAGLRLVGICDTGEEEVFRRALVAAAIGRPTSRADLARLGFHVCVADLEDELIRAVGTRQVELLLESQGDLDSFRRLQSQPAWRGRDTTAQLRRYLAAGSARKLRYARLLVQTVEPHRVPEPLVAVLGASE